MSRAAAMAQVVFDTRACRLTQARGTAVGIALAPCPPTRVRCLHGCWPALVACDSVRVKNSAAAALRVALASGAGRRIRISPLATLGAALVTDTINKLVFPALVPGLRVRRWSKPAGVLDPRTGGWGDQCDRTACDLISSARVIP